MIFGPGSLTINTKLGAGFGFSLLWVVLLAVILMSAFTAMASRIGLAIDQSLISEIGDRYGRVPSILIGIGIFLVTACFQAGNAMGAGLACGEIFHTSPAPWVLFFSVVAAALLFFRSFYRILEKVMIGLVLLMVSAFLLTVILTKPKLKALVTGLIPGIPSGAEFLTVALLASSFSIVGAFYQAYLVREKGWRAEEARVCVRESNLGVGLLGLLSGLVMICAAAVLHEQGITVNAASDLGLALEPLFGRVTVVLFMVGFFAASFSSLIGNATIGGSILADALSMGSRLEEVSVRGTIILVIVAGASVALAFGRLPLELIVVAQGITALVVPAIALVILVLAGSGKVMGPLRNKWGTNAVGWFGMLVVLLMMAYNVKYLFFS